MKFTVALENDRVRGHRLRPVRRARWRRYAPALTTLLLAAAAIVAAEPIASFGADLTLGARASATIAASLVVGLAAVTAALCDRSPARWYVAGAFAVSVGANLAPAAWVALPVALLGLAGVIVQELHRFFGGLTLGPQGLTLHRPLKDPLTVDHAAVEAVHTSPTMEGAGTLILETQHGTVTARDLPDVEQLQARIEARTSRLTVEDPTAAARDARERIQTLLRGESPT